MRWWQVSAYCWQSEEGYRVSCSRAHPREAGVAWWWLAYPPRDPEAQRNPAPILGPRAPTRLGAQQLAERHWAQQGRAA